MTSKKTKKKEEKHTATCLGQLDQPQRRVVRRHGLKGNVRVPLCIVLLFEADALVGVLLGVKGLGLLRGNGANLGVIASQLALVVDQGMDVQSRR